MLCALPFLSSLARSLLISHVASANSQCFGGVANGRIEGSVKLLVSGPNLATYSALASGADRTHVHSTVAVVRLFALLGVSELKIGEGNDTLRHFGASGGGGFAQAGNETRKNVGLTGVPADSIGQKNPLPL